MTAPGDVMRRTLPPAQARDRLLWMTGRALSALHERSADDPERCSDWRCGRGYPCARRRQADRAMAASLQGWPHTWTARHDLRSVGLPVAPSAAVDAVTGVCPVVQRTPSPVDAARGGAR